MAKRVPGNAMTGEAVIVLPDCRRIVLQLTNRRMLELQAELGDDYQEVVQQALRRTDLAVLTRVMAVAVRQQQPDMTLDDVLDLDVPWNDQQAALLVAWRRFFWGDAPPPALPELSEGEDAGPLAPGATR